MRREERIDSILSLVRADRLIIIDGRLESRDEAALIRKTMTDIDDDFHGIELGVLYDCRKDGMVAKTKHRVANVLTGRNPGLTIVGPASIISEMRQYPESVVIHFNDLYVKRHGGSSKDVSKNVSKNTKDFMKN